MKLVATVSDIKVFLENCEFREDVNCRRWFSLKFVTMFSSEFDRKVPISSSFLFSDIDLILNIHKLIHLINH